MDMLLDIHIASAQLKTRLPNALAIFSSNTSQPMSQTPKSACADKDNSGKARIGFRLRPAKDSPARADAMDRLTIWTRDRFALPAEAPVMVCELTCTTPGCPPIETLVAFWTETGERRHFKIFKTL